MPYSRKNKSYDLLAHNKQGCYMTRLSDDKKQQIDKANF